MTNKKELLEELLEALDFIIDYYADTILKYANNPEVPDEIYNMLEEIFKKLEKARSKISEILENG